MRVRVVFEWDVDVPDLERGDLEASVERLLAGWSKQPFGRVLQLMTHTVEEISPWEQNWLGQDHE